MTNRRIQISDVAQLAGVSPATVSVVVNNRIGENIRVAPETVKRVWNAVKELGYLANPVAQRLAGGSNKIIGLFTYESIFPINFHNFYYPFLVGIEDEIEKQGYDLLLFTSVESSPLPRSIFKGGVSRLNITEGSILLGLNEDKHDLIELLKHEYPFVFIGRRELPSGNISYVAADYKQATEQIVTYIAGFGHQKIAYIHSNIKQEAQIDRNEGFLLGLKKAALRYDKNNDLICDSLSLSINDLSKCLEGGVTAFVVENNVLAEQLLVVAGQLKKSPIIDFSFAVLGDSIDPPQPSIDWTMFQIPRREMGAEAVKMLIKMFASKESSQTPYRKTLSCLFIPGATVGPIPSKQ